VRIHRDRRRFRRIRPPIPSIPERRKTMQKTVVVNDPQANNHSQIVVTVGIGF
jgi:hypothetical protein